jgi:hypothetical protein
MILGYKTEEHITPEINTVNNTVPEIKQYKSCIGKLSEI